MILFSDGKWIIYPPFTCLKENKYWIAESKDTEIAGYLFGNRLVSIFEIEHMILTSTYELRGDALFFEATLGTNENSGSEGQSYEIGVLQHVLFKKTSE